MYDETRGEFQLTTVHYGIYLLLVRSTLHCGKSRGQSLHELQGSESAHLTPLVWPLCPVHCVTWIPNIYFPRQVSCQLWLPSYTWPWLGPLVSVTWLAAARSSSGLALYLESSSSRLFPPSSTLCWWSVPKRLPRNWGDTRDRVQLIYSWCLMLITAAKWAESSRDEVRVRGPGGSSPGGPHRLLDCARSPPTALDSAGLLLLYRRQPGPGGLSALHTCGLHPLQLPLPGEGCVCPQHLPSCPRLSSLLGETQQDSGSLSDIPPLLHCKCCLQTDDSKEFLKGN